MSKVTSSRSLRQAPLRAGSFLVLALGIFMGLAPGTYAGPSQQEPTEPVSLVFERPTETALALTSKEVHDLTLVELTTKLGDGKPRKRPASMKLLSRVDALVLDEYADAQGADASIRRRYQAMEAFVEVSNPSLLTETGEPASGQVLKISSPLVDLSVIFTPAASQPGGFGRMYDSQTSREFHLAALSAPVDWSGMLVPVAQPGQTWSIPLEQLEALIAPSGYLGWTFERPEVGAPTPDAQRMERAFSSGLAGNLQVPFAGELVGEPAMARVTAVGMDPEQGPYAELLISFDFTMGQRSRDALEGELVDDEALAEIEVVGMDLEVGLKGTVILKWALDQQRPMRALVEADETVISTVRARPEGGEIATETVRMEGRLLNGLTWTDRALAPLAKPPVVVESRPGAEGEQGR